MRRPTFDPLRDAIAVRATAGWVLWEGADRLGGLGVEDVSLFEDGVLRWGGRLWRVTDWRERGGELRLKVRSAFGRTCASLRIAKDGEGPLAWGPDWFEDAVERIRSEADGPFVAIPPDAGNRSVDDGLAGGLVARERYEERHGTSSDLVVYSAYPAIRSVAERLAWLEPRAAVRVVDVTSGGDVRPHDQGMLHDGERAIWPTPCLEESELVSRILSVAPDVLTRARRPGERTDRIQLRGLECARVGPSGATFGIGRRRERLNADTWQRFEGFVRELASLRSPTPPDRNHPAFRMFPERWLASLLAADPTIIDVSIDPAVIYEQVPARRGDSRERIDLLGVTHTRRLAVIELKAAEDRALPFQGLDYWSRVRWHHARGDISRRGYFPGMELDPRPPVLFLVAPLFRFHASVRVVLDLLAADVEATAVGLNTGWRRRTRAIAHFTKRT